MAEDNPKIPNESINGDDFRKALESQTKIIQDFTQVQNLDSIKELLGLKEEVSKMGSAVESLHETYKESEDKREKHQSKDEKIQKSILRSQKKNFSGLTNLGQALGTISIKPITPDITLEEVKPILGGGGGGGGPTIPPPTKGAGGGGGGGDNEYEDNAKKFAEKLEKFFMKTSANILGGFSIKDLFSGSLKDVVVYRKNMRLLAYELEGITENARGLQHEFSDLGDDVSKLTGLSRDETMEAYEKLIKKGVKSRKDAKQFIKTSLHTATMLGADAQSTAEMFGNWHRTLGMTTAQMDQMARDSRDIAKSTGITGDELVGVMKRTENIMKNLRNQGNLTSSSMKNVIKASAEAEKLGVGEKMTELLDALSSSQKFLFDTDQKTQTFLLAIGNKIGKVDEMSRGVFTKTRANMKLFAEGMEGTLSDLTGGAAKTFEDIGKLNETQRMNLNLILNSMGTSLGEFERLGHAYRDAGKGLGESLDELNKKMKSSTATVEEKKIAEQEYDNAIRNAGMSMLNKLSQEIKDSDKGVAESAARLLEKMTKSELEEFDSDISAIAKELGKSTEGMSAVEKMQLASVAAAERLQKKAKAEGVDVEDFSSQIKSAIASGDSARIREIESAMSKAQQKIDMKEKKGVDPISDLNQTLIETNDYLRQLVGSWVGYLIDVLGKTGLIFLAFGSYLTGIFTKFISLFGSIDKLTNTIFNLPSTISKLGGNMVQGFWKLTGKAANNPFLGMSGTMGKAAQQTFIKSMTSKIGAVLTKWSGPLQLAMGALTGAMEAKEAKRTMGEGAALGALTGGAKTGSFLSGTLGIEKGGTADKALGVAGGAAWGAAAGAAIGSAFFGIGAAPGALIGAIVGGLMEIIKIITEGTTILADVFAPIQVVIDTIYEISKYVYEAFAGLFTLDFSRMFKAMFNGFASAILLVPKLLLASLRSVFIGLPRLIGQIIMVAFNLLGKLLYSIFVDLPIMLLNGLRYVFVQLPMYILDSIKNTFASLAKNEWIGPIFQVFSDAFGFIYDGFKAIIDPISELFDVLYEAGVGIYDAFASIGEVFSNLWNSIFGASEGAKNSISIMDALKWAINGLSKIIAIMLFPVKILAKALGFVLKIVGGVIKAIVDSFKWLISLFSSIPGRLYDALYWAASKFNLGWLFEKLAGKKGGVKEKEKEKESKELPKAIQEQMPKEAAQKAVDSAVIAQNEEIKRRVMINDAINAAEQGLAIKEDIEAKKMAIPMVQPVHPRDIGETMLREKAGAEPGKLQSDELSRMEQVANNQVQELEMIREGIYELVDLMKPRGGSSIAGDSTQLAASTRDPRRPMHSANFGLMKYGKPSDEANRDLINNGEV